MVKDYVLRLNKIKKVFLNPINYLKVDGAEFAKYLRMFKGQINEEYYNDLEDFILIFKKYFLFLTDHNTFANLDFYFLESKESCYPLRLIIEFPHFEHSSSHDLRLISLLMDDLDSYIDPDQPAYVDLDYLDSDSEYMIIILYGGLSKELWLLRKLILIMKIGDLT